MQGAYHMWSDYSYLLMCYFLQFDALVLVSWFTMQMFKLAVYKKAGFSFRQLGPSIGFCSFDV